MRALGLTDTDTRLLTVANGQFGLLRHAQLVAHGLSRSGIARRLAAGRLTRVHDLVYAFGHTALRDEGRWLAALWACGPDAVLSHETGAAYHRWRTEDPAAPVHVTTTGTIRSREVSAGRWQWERVRRRRRRRPRQA
ncbi:MAG: hypothetical protein JWO02_1069 [Solirubrobacterales bacterium]|nr:hypothetical protein [Solirubrobacterales bacterium]